MKSLEYDLRNVFKEWFFGDVIRFIPFDNNNYDLKYNTLSQPFGIEQTDLNLLYPGGMYETMANQMKQPPYPLNFK